MVATTATMSTAASVLATTIIARTMTVPRGHRHDALILARWRRTSGRSAPRGLGCAEAGRERVLLAHIRTAPGFAVTSAAAGVVDFGYGIDPHHGIARA